ncbi:MAG: hypothetical protein HY901_33895 [Deltaproteobacteria bacterium]|nr:hypothetical protein [Deltaproteobacteria bacterium]
MAKETRRGRPQIPLLPTDKGPIREERTLPLTGHDATYDEAEFGDAGNGADWYGSELDGCKPIEDEAAGEDIQPDQVRLFTEVREGEEEREITARPNDQVPRDDSDHL